MSLEFTSLIIETTGTLMIAFAALRVHHRVLHEHDIDENVVRAMKLEQRAGIFGALLVFTAFLIDAYLII